MNDMNKQGAGGQHFGGIKPFEHHTLPEEVTNALMQPGFGQDRPPPQN